MDVDEIEAPAGDTAVLNVSMDDTEGVAAFSMAVSFPPELTLQAVIVGALDGTFSVTTHQIASGVILINGSSSAGTPLGEGAATLAELRFEVAGGATPGSELPVQIDEVSLTSAFGEDFAWYAQVQKSDGAVIVLEGEGPVCCCDTGNKQLPTGADVFLAGLSVAALLLVRRGASWRA